MICLPLVVRADNSNLSPRWGVRVGACVGGMYLLQEGELLGNVMSTVFILAKGEMLIIC